MNPLWKRIFIGFFRAHDNVHREIFTGLFIFLTFPFALLFWVIGWAFYPLAFAFGFVYSKFRRT